MSYTLGDQLDKLASLIGDPNDSADNMFPATQRTKEINRGELNLAIDAKDLIAYTTGTISGNSITLPSDYVDLYMIIINEIITLQSFNEISLEDYNRYSIGGDPCWYLWTDASGNELMNIIGTSISGDTYKLFYFKKPTTELSALTDTSLHREEFREGSVYYAASQLMLQIGKSQQSDNFNLRYQAMVQKADAWARSRYIRKNSAMPDLGPSGINATDIQGRSYIG